MFTYIWLTLTITLVNNVVAVQFNILSKDGGDIWVGILGNPGKPHLNNGGFALHSEQTISVDAPRDWAGVIWARTWCNPDTQHCATGDCGNKLECNGTGAVPPVTLIRIQLSGPLLIDFYSLSLLNGFNIKATFKPVNGSSYECKPTGCTADINTDCPEDLQIRNGNGIIACKSECVAYNTDEACCRGDYANPGNCSRSGSGEYFKSKCPDAVTTVYNDVTFICRANTYNITFGG